MLSEGILCITYHTQIPLDNNIVLIPYKMPATTHPEYGANTEAKEVAKGFAHLISGKTVVITGVNRKGIGFATAEAFVRNCLFTILSQY
jgi:hypothetical protein